MTVQQFYVNAYSQRGDGYTTYRRADLEDWLLPFVTAGIVDIDRPKFIRKPVERHLRVVYWIDMLIFHDDVVAVAFKMMFSDVIVMKYEESHEIYCFETRTWCLM
jgi:hypothetical protein